MDYIKHSRRSSFQNIRSNFPHIPIINLNKTQANPLHISPSFLMLSVQTRVQNKGGSCRHLNRSTRANLNNQKAQFLVKSQKYLSLIQSSTSSVRSSMKNSNRLTLANLKNLSIEVTLSLLIKILKECYLIHKRLGYSYFQIEGCELTYEGKISINMENMEKIYDEASIVKKIISNMVSISSKSYEDFFNFYQRVQKNNKCDFKYIISLIKSYTKCSQIQIGESIFDLKTSSRKSKTDFCKSLKATQNNFSSNKNAHRIPNNSFQTQEIQLSKLSQVRQRQNYLFFKKNESHSYKESKSLKNVKYFSSQTQTDVYFDHKFRSAQKECRIKQSYASTNMKTSTHHQSLKGDCFQSNITFGGKYGMNFFKYQNLVNMNELKTFDKEKKAFLNKQIAPFKQIKLQQVQSQTQSQEADNQVLSDEAKKKNKMLKIKQTRSISSQPQPEAYTKVMEQNHWSQKIDHNLIENKKLTHSYIQSRDELLEDKYKAEKLGQLARVMTQSLLGTGFSSNDRNRMGQEYF